MIQGILDKLDHVLRNGDGWTARCPAHDDHENSLSIGTTESGDVLLHCFKGCVTENVCRSLGLRLGDLYVNGAQARLKIEARLTVEALAEAKRLPVEFLRSLGVEDAGKAVRIRYLLADGSPAPRQRIRKSLSAKTGSSWDNAPGSPVPYGLWRGRSEPMILVEGESDCWTLWHHGLNALGIPGADMTGKLEREHLEGVSSLLVVREPDSGGPTFIRGLRQRLTELGWPGEARAIIMPADAKDPSALYVREPGEFREAWEALISASRPLADVDDEVKDLLARIKADPGYAFDPAALATIASTRRTDRAGWARLKGELQRLRVSLRDLESALREEARDDTSFAPRTAGSMVEEVPAPDLIIPEPYFLQADGTGQIITDDDGKPQPRLIAYSPILITGRLRDADEGVESLRLTWHRPAGWLDRIVDRGIALEGRKLVELASDGFPVAGDNARDVARYLHRVEAVNYASLPAARVSSHLGWQGKDGRDGFLWGRTLLLPDGEESADLQLEDLSPFDWREDWISFRGLTGGDEQIADGFHAAGDLAGWVRAVTPLAAFPRVLLALYASFVPPLLPILLCPNFVIDWANRTSTGKTTALRVAASVWGNPDEKAPNACIGTWDATRVWLERASAVLSGLPLILDDTKKARDTRSIADLIYTVTSGRGRGRGNTKSLARTRTWRGILLSSGESPATAYTQDGGTRARCMEVRGVPFGTDDQKTRQVVDRLNLGILAHYGHAGPIFARYLLRHRDAWPEYAVAYRDAVEDYAAETSSAAAGRMAQYAGAIDMAAALAHAALPLPWSYADPLSLLWADITREAADASGDLRALHDVVSWAYAHAASFFGRHEEDSLGKVRMPAGGWSGRWDGGDWEWIAFLPTVLSHVLRSNGYEPEAILSGWLERGWLDVEEGRSYTKRNRMQDERPRMVTVRKAAIDEIGA